MQVLVAHSHKTANFITIAVECNKFVRLRIARKNNLREGCIPLAHVVDVTIANREVSHRDLLEFDALIEHVHRTVETGLDIPLDVVGAELYLVEETWVLRAAADRVHR